MFQNCISILTGWSFYFYFLLLILSLIKAHDLVWLTLRAEPKTGTEIMLVYLEDDTVKQQ